MLHSILALQKVFEEVGVSADAPDDIWALKYGQASIL